MTAGLIQVRAKVPCSALREQCITSRAIKQSALPSDIGHSYAVSARARGRCGDPDLEKARRGERGPRFHCTPPLTIRLRVAHKARKGEHFGGAAERNAYASDRRVW